MFLLVYSIAWWWTIVSFIGGIIATILFLLWMGYRESPYNPADDPQAQDY